jgi:predicted PurR-regulated permease PerM
MNRFKKISTPISLASTLIAIVILVYIAFILQDIIVPFVFAALLSFLLYPICQWLENKKVPRILAIIFSIILVVGILVLIIYAAYTQIIQLESLFPMVDNKVQVWISDISKFLNSNFGIQKSEILAEGQKYLSEAVKTGSKLVGATLGSTSNFLLSLGLMPLYIFLMLMYRDFLNTFVFKWLKDTSKHKIMTTINKVKEVVKSYILGLVLVILIVGALNSAALYFIGIDHALFFGFFAAVLVIIPYIGVAIGSALPIFVALVTKDSYLAAAAVAASFAAIQFLEGNFITPYVVGNQVSINALVAITALLLFGNLWGIGGMILALPVTAILKVIFDSNERLSAWGFLLGDAENEDVRIVKKHFRFREFYDTVKKKI